MDQFDRSRFYWANDHALRAEARRSRPGPRGPLGALDRDQRGRPLLAAALIVAVVTLLILVLAQIASDRQAGSSAAGDEAIEARATDGASRTLVRPPGWIASGQLPSVVLEAE